MAKGHKIEKRIDVKTFLETIKIRPKHLNISVLYSVQYDVHH